MKASSAGMRIVLRRTMQEALHRWGPQVRVEKTCEINNIVLKIKLTFRGIMEIQAKHAGGKISLDE